MWQAEKEREDEQHHTSAGPITQRTRPNVASNRKFQQHVLLEHVRVHEIFIEKSRPWGTSEGPSKTMRISEQGQMRTPTENRKPILSKFKLK